MMTDEQLDMAEIRLEVACDGCVRQPDVKVLLAELRRHRELERAAWAVWQEFKAGRAFACDARKRRITREALDTIAVIGRLLEGEGE